jgi:hypothetical protein
MIDPLAVTGDELELMWESGGSNQAMSQRGRLDRPLGVGVRMRQVALALLVLSMGAMFRAWDSYLVRLTGGAWLAFSVPHLIYHVAHRDMYDTRDQVLNIVALGVPVLLAGSLLLPGSVERSPEAPKINDSRVERTMGCG